MNITLTTRQLEGLAYGTASRNTSNPNAAPMTDDEFAADLLGVRLDAYADEKEAAIRAALAQNDDLMRVGKAVSLAPPNKQAAAIAAAEAALLSVHIPKQ